MPRDPWDQQIHDRLLRKDPTASAECAEAVIGPLTKHLEGRYPKLRGSDFLADAVTDAVFSYLKRPEQYDPTKRGLLGFLSMAADGDLKNAIAKRNRRTRREEPLDDVDLQTVAGNRLVGGTDTEIDRVDDEMLSGVQALFPEPRDRRMMELLLDGERSVEAYARILGIEHLPASKKRHEVKRQKDRLKKRLQRYGQKIRRKVQ